MHVDNNLLQLLRSLKPYIGNRSLKCCEAMEAFSELIDNEKAMAFRDKIKALKQSELPGQEQQDEYLVQEDEADAKQDKQLWR